MDFRVGVGNKRVFPHVPRVVQVDIHGPELGMNHPVEVGICADIKAALTAMLNALASEQWPKAAWLTRLREFGAEWRRWLDAAAGDAAQPLHPAAFFAELRKALPADVLYSWDGGDFAHWGRAMLQANRPGGWIRLGPLATIGAALPNALALQMAHPGKPVAMITGDGALGFYIAELDTAVRHGLPIVIIVGNDAGWGLERQLQGGVGTVGCELRPTRYDIVMKGFGGEGETVDTVEQVGPAVRRAFASGRPYLLNVNIRGERSPFTRWKLGND
jgi:acetolactate synthase-1/2/3 large subunit